MQTSDVSGANDDLFRWQDGAVEKWIEANGQGIVVGMTGTGKTHVAVKAIRRLQGLGKRLSPLIVVPTTALLDQWLNLLRREFPGEIFGRIGDGSRDDFAKTAEGALPFAIVSTIHSAVPAIERGLFDHCGADHLQSFVIADECHRYANEDQLLFNRLLRRRYDHILGLSATVDRFEIDGLGRIVYDYDINTAVKDGVIPSFTVVNVGINFDDTERSDYLKYGKMMREMHDSLLIAYPELEYMEGNQRWNFLKCLVEEGDAAACRYMGALFKRTALAHESSAKLRLIPKLIEMLVNKGRRKVLVFFERTWTADAGMNDALDRVTGHITSSLKAEEAESGDSLWCKVYHSKLHPREREAVLTEFRAVGPSALLACRSLDEGLDVPSVDVGILVASTQSSRQRLQRIGRTLRRGDGNKKPIILILYVKGTVDESVAIQANDPNFSIAATVFNATDKDAIQAVAELLDTGVVTAGGCTVRTAPSTLAAPPRPSEPSINESEYVWDAGTREGSLPSQVASAARKLSARTAVRLQLGSGKLVLGTVRAVIGDELMLLLPTRAISLKSIARFWVGKKA